VKKRGVPVIYESLYDGKKVPVVGLGTWKFGGEMTADHSHDDKTIDTIMRAVRMGYSHIDTAQMYGGGHTEELVGKALKPFKREELFITTKVWSSNLRHLDVLREFDTSLKKLGTEYVDLFLIHWPNPVVPLKDTFRAFNEIVKSGRVKYVGVSNFSIKQLKRAQALSDIPMATNQVEFSLLCREPEKSGLLEYCQKNDILLTAYEPLGKGRIFHNPELRRIASSSNATLAQIAIKWLIRKPKVITIPMSSKESHLRENIEAVDLALPAEILEILDRLYGG
jgi:diketogulonate reductase-like aldo/keto reductase